MASTTCLAATSYSLVQKDRVRQVVASIKSCSPLSSVGFLCRSPSFSALSHSIGNFASSLICPFVYRKRIGNFAVLAVVDEEAMAEEDSKYEQYVKEINGNVPNEKESVPCELYMCNLPRRSGIAELLKMFQPFGTVVSAQDVGEREMRVRFSVDMNTGSQFLNSTPKKNLIYESPHVGNLGWSVKPEDLRDHFIQFGTMDFHGRTLLVREGIEKQGVLT